MVRKNLWCFKFIPCWRAVVSLAFAVASAATPAVLAGANEPAAAASIDAKIASEISRLIPQIDRIGTESLEGAEAPDASSPSTPVASGPKPKQYRPIYRRMHGISAGTRIDWVAEPAGAESSTPKSVVPEYQALAAAGNSRAMTLLGLMYHRGAGGLKQDYGLAYEWYLKAMDQGDGDALDNLAVLYRDGLGVKKASKIAYLIFLSVYKQELGSKEAQERAALNIQRLVQEFPKPEIHEALSYTWPYVEQVIRSRGTDWDPTPAVLPERKRPRIRDNDWWSNSERATMTFSSPAPWDKVKVD